MSEIAFGDRIIVKTGDITEEDVDAIVNAANGALMGGGGVDGAIHRAGGPRIKEECVAIREATHPDGLPTGDAVITTAGNLTARHVIHTVGPVWHGGGHGEQALLRACYVNSLRVAVANNVETMAFPAISTGVYGYPPDQAAEVASKAVSGFLLEDGSIRLVAFVLFGEGAYRTFVANARF